jgi:hypothetical protein
MHKPMCQFDITFPFPYNLAPYSTNSGGRKVLWTFKFRISAGVSLEDHAQASSFAGKLPFSAGRVDIESMRIQQKHYGGGWGKGKGVPR